MQDGQVIGVGEGLVSCLVGGELLAVILEHGGQHAEIISSTSPTRADQ